MAIKLKSNNNQNTKVLNNNDPHKDSLNEKTFKAKEELYKAFVDDMINSAVEIEINKEDIDNANKKFKQIKRKKQIFYITFIGIFVIIAICAIKKTFFTKQYTGQEIANIANFYNGKTNFPSVGVQGYLSENIIDLLGENISYNKDTNNIIFGVPVVTRINDKNDFISNVYFNVKINTNMGENNFTCMIPIYYDKIENKYHPCGEIIMTPLISAASSLESKNNPLMSFSEIDAADETDTNNSGIFVKNFFNMLYSGNDVSPYYKGRELDTGDLKFLKIDGYTLYKEKNINGYNAKCEITLGSENGVIYTTDKYIIIEKSGSSWLITGVL